MVKTGKKETVAGYACSDWEVTNADRSKLDLCVAEKGASFFHFPSLAGIPTEHAWALELVDGKHFPLKGVSFGLSLIHISATFGPRAHLARPNLAHVKRGLASTPVTSGVDRHGWEKPAMRTRFFLRGCDGRSSWCTPSMA